MATASRGVDQQQPEDAGLDLGLSLSLGVFLFLRTDFFCRQSLIFCMAPHGSAPGMLYFLYLMNYMGRYGPYQKWIIN
jgi:hypothetical protein